MTLCACTHDTKANSFLLDLEFMYRGSVGSVSFGWFESPASEAWEVCNLNAAFWAT